MLFAVEATDWRDLTSWKASAVKQLPQLRANGYEDPYVWPDRTRMARDGRPVYHALFHNMIGGWHGPEFNNTQVGAHAYSADGGATWVDTGVAFNLTVEYEGGESTTYIQRERPHLVLDKGEPAYLWSMTWSRPSRIRSSPRCPRARSCSRFRALCEDFRRCILKNLSRISRKGDCALAPTAAPLSHSSLTTPTQHACSATSHDAVDPDIFTCHMWCPPNHPVASAPSCTHHSGVRRVQAAKTHQQQCR